MRKLIFRPKMKMLLATLGFSSGLLLTGCGGATSDSVSAMDTTSTTASVVVERGPILYSHVIDSLGVKATSNGGNTYRFSLSPSYPIYALGGYIDLDGSGTISAGDLELGNLQLQAQQGQVLTLGSTIAMLPDFVSALENVGLSFDTLTQKTPSEDKSIAALSDTVFAYMIENGYQRIEDIPSSEYLTIAASVETNMAIYLQSDLSALELENQVVADLETVNLVSTLTENEAADLNLQLNTSPIAVTQASFGEYNFTAEQQHTFNQLIAFSWNEEKMAKDLYLNLYDTLFSTGVEVKSLANVANNSEAQHQETMRALLEKYDLDISQVSSETDSIPNGYDGDVLELILSGQFPMTAVQTMYDELMSHAQNHSNLQQGALEAACMVEVVDVNDLNDSIQQANELGAYELVVAFENLRAGSYNHYWAFNNALVQMGVSSGCGVLGADYIKDYPQVPKGNGNH